MKIKQLMKKPVIISPSATKGDILKTAKKHKDVQIFIVADKDKNFLGDIHENDLFYMLIPNRLYSQIGSDLEWDLERKFFAKTAKELMRKHDICCLEDDDVMDVVLKFARVEVNEMPVLNKQNKVVGVINQGILLRHMKIK